MLQLEEIAPAPCSKGYDKAFLGDCSAFCKGADGLRPTVPEAVGLPAEAPWALQAQGAAQSFSPSLAAVVFRLSLKTTTSWSSMPFGTMSSSTDLIIWGCSSLLDLPVCSEVGCPRTFWVHTINVQAPVTTRRPRVVLGSLIRIVTATDVKAAPVCIAGRAQATGSPRWEEASQVRNSAN